MSERGFTLIELLIACLLLLVVTAGVAAVAAPARNALERTLGAADVTAGSRFALDRIVYDLREAGSGAAVAEHGLDLGDVVPVVVPHVSLDDLTVATPGRAITVFRIARGAAQGRLLGDLAAGSDALQLDITARCVKVGVACGLQPGVNVVIFDGSRASNSSIRAVAAGGFVQLAAAVPVSFTAGAIVAATTVIRYGTRPNPDGSMRLVRYAVGGAEQPLLQNVVDFDTRVFGVGAPAMPTLDGSPPTYGPRAPGVALDDPRDAWPAGENCVIGRNGDGAAVPRLTVLSPTDRPLELTTAMLIDGPWCSDVADPMRFDADLLRIRGVEVRMRVEAASAALRGPSARLFRRPGTEQNAGRWVPDVELRARIALRNAE